MLLTTGVSAGAVTGTVVVAFTSTASPSSPLFQSMLLNVIGVRLNPATGAVSESDKRWQQIPAPGGAVGLPTPGQAQTELQIDLGSTQDLAQVLNAAKLPAKAYSHIELVLDPQNPGDFVPLCGNAQPRGEGCIVYQAKLLNTNIPIQVQGAVSFTITKNTTIPLVLNIDPGIAGVPTDSAGSVIIDPVITEVPNQTFSGVVGNPQMALVSGTVKKPGGKQVVRAQLTGTSQVVASVATQTDGAYALNLPATAAGTTYDLVTFGNGREFAVKSAVTVFPGQNTILNFTPAVHGQIEIGGKVFDACTGAGLEGATLEMLLPDPAITPAPDCTASAPATPAGCVVVATAQSTAGGTYPAPSTTVKAIPQFKQIPTGIDYTIKVSSSGYNDGNIALLNSGGTLRCSQSGFKNAACNINLEHGEIDAVVSLGAANTGPPLNAMVVAEQSGTNDLVGMATATIPTGAAESAPVPVFVPDTTATVNPIATIDFFASVQDSFGTATSATPEKATGHTIAVAAAVPGSGKCPLQANVTPASIVLAGAGCVGHGSVEGTVGTVDSNTVVVLATHGVQVMQTGVPTGTMTPGEFSFCAPADLSAAYTLGHFERQPDGSLTPVSSVATTLAGPTTIAAPCSGICGNTAGSCLLCTGVSNASLP